ncbi:phage terminase large subunit family protein [Pseudazoarcus pumilus]|uniref:Terminase n=1 Tax=Pseudazoarcus pumilus TaxID=2067960 RepID=A0A2I6S827_9RHOO|nr:phage terminase large subunit family protein [Pseudazoarcus pumilus]AUN95414.1 terminase [Pseudazoarcus pumilus]
MNAPLLPDATHAPAAQRLAAVAARAVEPRKPITVSQWADLHFVLSSKSSAEPGRWRTDRNPPLREPMDCMSARSSVKDVTAMFPIQFGKSEIARTTLGYVMDHAPAPVMVCLPGEVSMLKWVNQKLNPMIEDVPVVSRALVSTASRDASNTRTFKDFAGGQLYMEHAGSPQRLKQTSVRHLIVDELDEFAGSLTTGDDPVDMLEGRTSAFPGNYKRLFISTPGLLGVSRTHAKYLKSDRRRYHVPCPHCGHRQPLEWSGLHWDRTPEGVVTHAWYVCQDCGAMIDEHHKTAMIAAGQWVPENPEAKTRGYHINCLYYQLGLGPRWADLAEMWIAAQSDPARLKTFVNDRLAEPWEDPAMRAVKHNLIADRAEAYPLRTAPEGVLAITAGVDTQDNRLAVHVVGWGRGMSAWTIDYIELPGDPAEEAVWTALTDLLNRPIQHVRGGLLRVEAVAIDAGGHRTEAVKAFVRRRVVHRPMAIFGAVPNNAPVLSRPKAQDVTWSGRTDKRGVMIWHVGTVAIKHMLFSRLSTDADKDQQARLVHFSDELPHEFYTGLVSETYNPAKNRFEKRRGARNEPLDTWGYAYAAAHHPELRLHRRTKADWDAAEARVIDSAEVATGADGVNRSTVAHTESSDSDHDDDIFAPIPMR